MNVVYNGSRINASARAVRSYLAMTETDNQKMSVEQVCAFLEISRPTLFKLVGQGRITPLPGNPLKEREAKFFRRSDVLALRPDKTPPA